MPASISSHRVFTPYALALLVGLAAAVPANAASECTCRYAGQSYQLTTCICMSTPNGPRTACCGQVLNNTSWKFVKDGCDVAENRTDSQTPATQAMSRALAPPVAVNTVRDR